MEDKEIFTHQIDAIDSLKNEFILTDSSLLAISVGCFVLTNVAAIEIEPLYDKGLLVMGMLFSGAMMLKNISDLKDNIQYNHHRKALMIQTVLESRSLNRDLQ